MPAQNQQQNPKASTATRPPPAPLDPELAAELEADKLAAEQESANPVRSGVPDERIGSHPDNHPQLEGRRTDPARNLTVPSLPPAPSTDPAIAVLLEQNRLMQEQMLLLQAQLKAAMQGHPGGISANAPVPVIQHKNAPSAEMKAELAMLQQGIWPDRYKKRPNPDPLVPGFSNPPGATQDDARIEYARVVRWHWERQQNGEKDFVRCWD